MISALTTMIATFGQSIIKTIFNKTTHSQKRKINVLSCFRKDKRKRIKICCNSWEKRTEVDI